MAKPLHERYEIHKKEDWDAIRHLRYVRQEDIGNGTTRVDLFDDARKAEIAVYCPTGLLPDSLFWTD